MIYSTFIHCLVNHMDIEFETFQDAAVTHTSNSRKQSVEVDWKPSPRFEGNLVFVWVNKNAGYWSAYFVYAISNKKTVIFHVFELTIPSVLIFIPGPLSFIIIRYFGQESNRSLFKLVNDLFLILQPELIR